MFNIGAPQTNGGMLHFTRHWYKTIFLLKHFLAPVLPLERLDQMVVRCTLHVTDRQSLSYRYTFLHMFYNWNTSTKWWYGVLCMSMTIIVIDPSSVFCDCLKWPLAA
jgi:hypothetical protein